MPLIFTILRGLFEDLLRDLTSFGRDLGQEFRRFLRVLIPILILAAILYCVFGAF